MTMEISSEYLDSAFRSTEDLKGKQCPPEIEEMLKKIKEEINVLYKEATLFKMSKTPQEVILSYLLKALKYCEELESSFAENELLLGERGEVNDDLCKEISNKIKNLEDKLDYIILQSSSFKTAMFVLYEEANFCLSNGSLCSSRPSYFSDMKIGKCIKPKMKCSRKLDFGDEACGENIKQVTCEIQAVLVKLQEMYLKVQILEQKILDCHRQSVFLLSTIQSKKLQPNSCIRESKQEEAVQVMSKHPSVQTFALSTSRGSSFEHYSEEMQHTLCSSKELASEHLQHIHSSSVQSSSHDIHKKKGCAFVDQRESQQCAKEKLKGKILHLDFVQTVPYATAFSSFNCFMKIKEPNENDLSSTNRICHDTSVSDVQDQKLLSVTPIYHSSQDFTLDEGYSISSFVDSFLQIPYLDQQAASSQNLNLYDLGRTIPIFSCKKQKSELNVNSFCDYFSSSHDYRESVITQLPLSNVNHSDISITVSAMFLVKFIDSLVKEKTRSSAEQARLLNVIGQLESAKAEVEEKSLYWQRQCLDELAKKEELRKRANFIISKQRKEFLQLILILQEERETLSKQVSELKNVILNLEKEVETMRHLLLINSINQNHDVAELRHQIQTEALKYERAIRHYGSYKNALEVLSGKIADQEKSISALENAFITMQSDFRLEREQQLHELQDLYVTFNVRDEECMALTEDLKKCVADLDDECQQNIALTSQLAELKKSSDETRMALETELNLWKSDFQVLRTQLIKLTKEKDMLWKRAARLTYAQNSQFAGRWMNDGEAAHCLGCKNRFSFTLRKHHCRLCGKIFCHSCSNNWLVTAASRCQTRVCNDCYVQHMQLKKVVKDGSSLHVMCDVSEEDDLVDSASLIHNRYDPGLSSSVNSTLSVELYGTDVCEFRSDSHENSHSVNQSVIEKESSRADMDRNCNFDVITDEEIAKSLSTSSPYNPVLLECEQQGSNTDSGLSLTLTRTVSEIEAAGSDGVTGEIWISAGTMKGIPILCDSPPVELHWKFVCDNKTDNKTIAFNIFHVENEHYAEVHTSESLPCEEGSTIFLYSGVYILQFDNSFSRVKARKVQYILWITPVCLTEYCT